MKVHKINHFESGHVSVRVHRTTKHALLSLGEILLLWFFQFMFNSNPRNLVLADSLIELF